MRPSNLDSEGKSFFSVQKIFLRESHKKIEWLCCLIVSGILTVHFYYQHNLDRNWDRAAYHDYVGRALIHGWLRQDWLAANINSWSSPFSEWPLIFFEKTFGAVAGGVLLALLISSITTLILWKFSELIIDTRHAFSALRVSSVILSLLSPFWLAELGTTMQNWLSVPFVIGGLFLALTATKQTTKKNLYFFSGIAFGLGISIKFTNLIYAAAMLLTLLIKFAIVKWDRKSTVKQSGRAMLGIFLGLVPIIPWWIFTFLQMKNPIFPYMNQIFRSPYYPKTNFRDERWVFHSFLDMKAPISGWFFNPAISELHTVDYRLSFVFLFLLLLLISGVHKWKRELWSDIDFSANSLFLIWIICSFTLWTSTFFYSRYLEPVEMLLGITVCYLMSQLIKNRHMQLLCMWAILILTICTLRPPNWTIASSTPGLGNSINRWESPLTELIHSKSGIVLVSGEPVAFLRQNSPSITHMIRIDGFDVPTTFIQVIKKDFEAGKSLTFVQAGQIRPENDIEQSLKSRLLLAVTPKVTCQVVVGPITVPYQVCTVN